MMTRNLDWPDCRNTRDLGGIPARGGVTRSKVLIRSDNVASLTRAGRQAMFLPACRGGARRSRAEGTLSWH
jgi:hypothetical protein